MLDLLARGWRIGATGFSFALFGAGGVLLRIAVFPLLHLLVRRPARRVALSRSVIRIAFRGYIELLRLLGVLRYEIEGRERLKRGGLLILANHPTLIDTVFLMAFVRQADCIVKAELWNNPFTRGPVRAAGYIPNTGGPELLAACIASLERNNNLIVFPEGTRTGAGGVVHLKRGAANIAVRGARDITPVLIRCEPPTLGKGSKWWQVPPQQACFRIVVDEDLPIRAFTAGAESEGLAARALTAHLQHYFMGKPERHA